MRPAHLAVSVRGRLVQWRLFLVVVGDVGVGAGGELIKGRNYSSITWELCKKLHSEKLISNKLSVPRSQHKKHIVLRLVLLDHHANCYFAII